MGQEGKIIGVDISEAMLQRARNRVSDAGWQNVELVLSSAAKYTFAEGLDGIIATGVLTYEPDYDEVIERGAKALRSGKRWVVFDYKMPNGWFRHFVPLFIWIFRSFGVASALFERKPWELIKRHLSNAKIEALYFGLVFVAPGEAS